MKKSKLKKRLRKKLHVGEFRELGFHVKVRFEPNLEEAAFDRIYDEFIALIEENKLAFGGGGSRQSFEGFITGWEKFRSPTVAQREKISNWLESQPEIAETEVGKLKDAWYDIK